MSVKWVEHHWEVTYLKTDAKDAQKNVTINCDFVIVASGQYVKPNMPKFPGLDTFKGIFFYFKNCMFISSLCWHMSCSGSLVKKNK